MQSPACLECEKLRAHCELLEENYTLACGALNGYTGAAEYRILRRAADDAQVDVEIARLDFQDHLRLHLTPGIALAHGG